MWNIEWRYVVSCAAWYHSPCKHNRSDLRHFCVIPVHHTMLQYIILSHSIVLYVYVYVCVYIYIYIMGDPGVLLHDGEQELPQHLAEHSSYIVCDYVLLYFV